MPVVSNTSPILNLAVTGYLALLHDQFGEIWIPPAVLDELRVEEDLPGSQAVREAIEAGWLQLKPVKNQALVRGEAEAIALAVQVEAEWTLLDEREGRRVARSLGLKVVGVLGILLRAWREGKVPSLRSVAEELQQKAGFRIGADLLAQLLKECGEEVELPETAG